jgi:hypothetical protein
MSTRSRVLLAVVILLALVVAFTTALIFSERNLPHALPNPQWVYAGTTTLDRNSSFRNLTNSLV